MLEGFFRSPRPMIRANGTSKCGRYLLRVRIACGLAGELFEQPVRWLCVNAIRKIEAGFESTLSFSTAGSYDNCPLIRTKGLVEGCREKARSKVPFSW